MAMNILMISAGIYVAGMIAAYLYQRTVEKRDWGVWRVGARRTALLISSVWLLVLLALVAIVGIGWIESTFYKSGRKPAKW